MRFAFTHWYEFITPNIERMSKIFTGSNNNFSNFSTTKKKKVHSVNKLIAIKLIKKKLDAFIILVAKSITKKYESTDSN